MAPVRSELPAIDILGVPVAAIDAVRALAEIERLVDKRRPAIVAYANAHTLNLAWADPAYRQLLCRADLVLNDGAGLAIAARVQGRRFSENLNGTDFTPRVLEVAAARAWGTFLLGGRPGVAERAAKSLVARVPGLRITGTQHGYSGPGEDAAIAETIRASHTVVVLVAMGNPHQEWWLDRHLEASGAYLGIGVGGLFDFSAGIARRAPPWMNRLGIEWIYRLAQEPRRLWRRYLLGNWLFLWRVACRRDHGTTR